MNFDDNLNNSLISNKLSSLPNITKKQCFYYIMLSNILFSIGVFIPKYLLNKFNEIYNPFSILFIRGISIIITSIITSKLQKVKLFHLKNLPHKKWFILKAILTFIRLMSFLYSLLYIRCITSQLIIVLFPLVYMTKDFINNNFEFTKIYIYCIFSCIIGTYLLISNEFLYSTRKNIIKGVLLSISSLLSQSFINYIDLQFGLTNYNLNNHLLYINFFIIIICIIYYLFSQFKFTLIYIIINLINGILFSIAVNLKMFYRKNLTIAKKYIWLNSFRVLYVYILLFLFSNEEENFIDLIGIFIIIVFLIYNSFPLFSNTMFY